MWYSTGLNLRTSIVYYFLYIIPHVISRMYADDATLTSSDHKMNDDVNLIQSWLTANKLTLNVKKTKYMLIGSRLKLSQIRNDFTAKVHNTATIARQGNQT